MTNDNHKIITTTTGESIYIFDDFFPLIDHYKFLWGAKNSTYKLLHSTENVNYPFYGCVLSENDMQSMNFFNNQNIQKISKFINNKTILRCWILSTASSTRYEYHYDNAGTDNLLTLTYFLNDKWDRNWGGETLFCNAKGETEIAVEYKPNRLLIFPSKLLHKPSLHSHHGLRYSLSIVFS